MLSVTPQGAGHVRSELGPLLALIGGASDSLSARDEAVVLRYLQATADGYRRYLSHE